MEGNMKKVPFYFLLALMVTLPLMAGTDSTLMLRFPDIHGNKLAFVYAGDIWTADVNGENIRRITSSDGSEFFPKFSPDGKWLAFTAEYDGYWQLYVMPAEGGTPKQLTYYPSQPLPDRFGYDKHAITWTPDGKYIIFRDQRGFWDAFVGRLYKISVEGGFPEPMPFAEGGLASFSPDGKKLALTRVYRDFRTWKRYKGGMAQNIWIYEFDTEKMYTVVDWKGTENQPIWNGDKIYFLADKTGKLNFYSYDVNTKDVKQITDYKDWDAKWPGYDNESIVYELGGKLFMMKFADMKPVELKIDINYDRADLRKKYVKVSENIDSADLSKDGKRVVATARGELFTLPAEKGNTRNISHTLKARERDADWSPDGKWIAYISDETGKEELYITDQYGKKKIQLTKGGEQILRGPVWSPDSKKIAYRGEINDLYYIDISSKKITKVDTAKSGRIGDYNWSATSDWLAYSKLVDYTFTNIYLYNLDKNKVYEVTSRATSDSEPVFGPDGKYLYFISLRDFTPSLGNFENSYVYNKLGRVYVATLRNGIESPLAPESDEVETDAKKEKKDKENKKDAEKTVIDIDGLGDRVAPLPMSPADMGVLNAVEGALFYGKREGGQNNLYAFDLKKRKEMKILDGIHSYSLSADKKKILWGKRNSLGIADAKPAKIDPSKGTVDISKMHAWVDPIREWKQIFREAWRLPLATFYVANMHGLDWPAIYKRYAPLVEHLAHRRDLTYLIGEMIGELGASHAYTGGGDVPEVKPANVGLLGAEFAVENGYYKISKIYVGENWRSDARCPLGALGVKASEGNYILEINGEKLRYPDNPYRLLQQTLGTIVTLKLNDKPEEKGAWTVDVKPVRSEDELRYLTWVKENAEYVEKKSGGKLGYVHVPDMGFHGLNQFVKTWYSQLDKPGIIIDDRYNGGGFVSQMILERLRRKVMGLRWNRLFGRGTYPGAAYGGHLIMLTNLYAASDGDNFPHFFKQYGLGKVIGTRTWGGVVGYYQVHPLMDGGYEIVPQSGSYSPEGKWWIENEGVTPDIVLDTSPVDQAKGKDPQMDKAIELLLKQIKEKPFVKPERPAPPVKLK